MNMSPEALYQLAKKMPVSALVGIVQGQPGTVPPSIALMVLNERNQQKIANAGMQAQGELQKPNVATQVAQQAALPEAQGVGMLAANNMSIPDDGIVGMAEGGGVKHFQVGGGTTVVPPIEPQGLRGFLQRIAPSLYVRERAPGELLQRGIYTEDPLAQLSEKLSIKERPPGGLGVAGTTNYADFYGGGTPAAPRPAAPGTARTRTAATPYTGPVAATPEALDFGTEKPVADASTARAAITAPAQAQGLPDILKPRENKYVNAMSEALAKLNKSPDEKDQRLGLLALNAAQALLAPGQTASGARGAALGKVAELTQKYTDSDKQTEKDRIGMQLGILGAQAGLEQGDTRLAIQYAEVAARDAAYKAEAEAKRRGLSLEEARDRGREAGIAEHNRILREQIQSRERTALAGYSRYAAAEKGVAQRERAANMRALLDAAKLEYQNVATLSPERKKELQGLIKSLQSKLAEDVGLPALAAANPNWITSAPPASSVMGNLFDEGV